MKSAGDSPSSTSRSQGALASWLPWIALPYGVVLVLLLARRADVVGLIHDDGVYLSMARSIEDGLGPVDGHGPPGARVARYPALQPAVLALARPLLGVGSEGLDGVRRLVALNGVWLAIALFAFLRWVTRWKRWPPLLAASAGALVFTLPYLIGFAQHLMSESLFLAELGVAVLLFERALARGTAGVFVLAGLVTGTMPATRAAGAAIVGGLLLHALLATRSWKKTAWFGAAALVPWFAAATWSAASQELAIGDSPLFRPRYLPLLLQNLGDVPWIVWVNVVRTADLALELFATGAPPAEGAASAIVRAGLGFSIAAAMGAGAIRLPRERRGPELLAAAAAVALIVLPWPFAEVRFLVPIAGLLVVAAVETIGALAARRGESGRAGPPRLATLAWSALFLALTLWNAPRTQRCFAATRDEVPYFFYEPIRAAPLREAAAWLARETPPDAVFASTLDPVFHLLAGRPGVSPWLNDQGFLENYADRASRWRTLYAGLPERDVARRMLERAPAVLAEYRRLGVRHVVVLRATVQGRSSAGSRVYDALGDQLVRVHPATSPSFTHVFTTTDRSIEIWRLD